MTSSTASSARRLAAALVAAAFAAPAGAHDTWFAALGAPSAAGRLLALGTGNRFPKQEFSIGHEQLAQRGCAGAGGAKEAPATLSALQSTASALLLRAAPAAGTPPGPMSCWAQLAAFEVDIEPAIVPLYLDEIHAEPAVRARWAAQQARGVRWHERYVKHARVELAAAGEAPADAPSTLAWDLRIGAAEGAVRGGTTRTFTLTHDGKAVAAQWLELVDAQGASAGWSRTDEAGRVRIALPAAGRWLLRGVALWPLDQPADGWESAFFTLAFDAR
jgi:hypothetical protein